MKTFTYLAILLVVVCLVSIQCNKEEMDREYELIWEDEFEGEMGTQPDSNVWKYDIGTDWGNQQLEFDTDEVENVYLDGEGNLVITAIQESYQGYSFTSGRIKTEDNFEFQYGRIEGRMKLPTGPGLWPAFWMLGNDISTIGWPQCGEIDIMEYRGQEPSKIHGSVHGPGYSGGNPVTSDYSLTNDRFNTGFHVFSIEWGEDFIAFFVDGNLYQTITPDDVSGEWVFNHPYFILVNLAVGGTFVGPPNQQTIFPQSLIVDYIKVFKEI